MHESSTSTLHVHRYRKRIRVFFQALVTVLMVGLLLGSFFIFQRMRQGPSSSGSIRKPAWQRLSSLHPSFSMLLGIAVIAPDDAWGVGMAKTVLIEHWNGKTWGNTTSPSLPGGVLSAISASATNNIWAVGYTVSGNPFHTLIEHWDGQRWSMANTPNPPGSSSQLTGVTALSPEDVWAVGKWSNGEGDHTLIEHWNGQEWSVVHSPNPGSSVQVLVSVAAVSEHDVWAVGVTYKDSRSQVLIEHWDGQQWGIVPGENPGRGTNILRSVAVVSAHDIWAVGFSSDMEEGEEYPSLQGRTLVEHWDGHQWRVVSSPNPGHTNMLRSVAVVSAHDIWAVGFSRASTDPNSILTPALIERWDGTSWQVQNAPKLQSGESEHIFYSIASNPYSNQVWVAGLSTKNPASVTDFKALVFRYA